MNRILQKEFPNSIAKIGNKPIQLYQFEAYLLQITNMIAIEKLGNKHPAKVLLAFYKCKVMY